MTIALHLVVLAHVRDKEVFLPGHLPVTSKCVLVGLLLSVYRRDTKRKHTNVCSICKNWSERYDATKCRNCWSKWKNAEDRPGRRGPRSHRSQPRRSSCN